MTEPRTLDRKTRLGFKGWYERRLIEGTPACLVLPLRARDRGFARTAFSVLGDYPKMNVRCRKCGNEWQLDN